MEPHEGSAAPQSSLNHQDLNPNTHSLAQRRLHQTDLVCLLLPESLLEVYNQEMRLCSL